jgi:hypothetical protein
MENMVMGALVLAEVVEKVNLATTLMALVQKGV